MSLPAPGHTGLFLPGALGGHARGYLPRMLEHAAATRANADSGSRPGNTPPSRFPYADNAFDLVTCAWRRHHFSDPGAFVREAARG